MTASERARTSPGPLETPASPTPSVSADVDRLRAQWQREKARRETALDSIRGHLEEQPSHQAVRSCARRWCTDIGALAEAVIKGAS